MLWPWSILERADFRQPRRTILHHYLGFMPSPELAAKITDGSRRIAFARINYLVAAPR
jgi:hypothetical protein